MSEVTLWYVCRDAAQGYLLVLVGDPIPEGWTAEATTANGNYIQDCT